MNPQEYVIGKPTGGVNTRTYPTELEDEVFAMLTNVDPFANIGAFVCRKGIEWQADLIGTATKPVRAGYRFYFGTSSTTRHLLAVAGTDLTKVVANSTGGVSIFDFSGTPTLEDKDWYFASYLDRCYITTSLPGQPLKRWDGTTFTNAGFPSVGAPTVATGAAGALTGAYKYKITAVYDSNSAHESSGGTASATVNPAAQRVELSAIPTPSSATARNIYRTAAGGTTYFFLATIADNVTTTYSDNTADASLSTAEVPTDNGIPPASVFVVFWRGRMVLARQETLPSRVAFSAITTTEASPGGGLTTHGADVEIFPASHYIDVGDDNRPITGLAVIQDQLVIFKEDQIWNISGDDAEDFRLWKAQSSVGCIAPKTIVNVRGTVLFLGRNEGSPGVYSYDGSSVDNLSLAIEPTLKANIYGLGSIGTQSIQPAAGYYRGCYLLSYRKTGGTTYEVAVLDTRPPRPRWLFLSNVEATCFIPFNGPDDEGEMCFGRSDSPRIFEMDKKLVDFFAQTSVDWTAIAMTVETGWLDLDAPYHLKTINWIDIYGKEGEQPGVGDTDPGDTTITVERRYDFATSGTSVDCSAVNVSTATKHMGRNLWKRRIHPEGSEGTVPEICYRMKLVITTSAPIEIHRIVINFTPSTPEDTVDQN